MMRWAPVLADSAAAVAMAALTIWLFQGLTDTRDAVALTVVMCVFGKLVSDVADRVTELRSHTGEEVDQQAPTEPRVWTGTWTDRWDRTILRVVRDGGDEVYRLTMLVDGIEGPTQPWTDRAFLGRYLRDVEEGDWTPSDDLGTRVIRAELGLPGWDRMPGENR